MSYAYKKTHAFVWYIVVNIDRKKRYIKLTLNLLSCDYFTLCYSNVVARPNALVMSAEPFAPAGLVELVLPSSNLRYQMIFDMLEL